MTPLAVLADYSFPTVDFALARIGEPLSSLAARLGFAVQSWPEDGLGAVRGAFLRLPSNRVVLLLESVHEADSHGAVGPSILVDAEDLGGASPGALIDDVSAALGLQSNQITWRQTPTVQEYAQRVADWSHRYRDAQRAGTELPQYPQR